MNKIVMLLLWGTVTTLYGMEQCSEGQKDLVSNQELAYACEQCSLQFTQKEDLELHITILHAEEKENMQHADSETEEESYTTDFQEQPLSQGDNSYYKQNNLTASVTPSPMLLVKRMVSTLGNVRSQQNNENSTSKASKKLAKAVDQKRRIPNNPHKEDTQISTNSKDKAALKKVQQARPLKKQKYDSSDDEDYYLNDREDSSFTDEDSESMEVEILIKNKPALHKKEEAQHLCVQCDKKFINPANLAAHKTTHEKQKTATCKQCKRTFSAQLYLDKHRCPQA